MKFSPIGAIVAVVVAALIFFLPGEYAVSLILVLGFTITGAVVVTFGSPMTVQSFALWQVVGLPVLWWLDQWRKN